MGGASGGGHRARAVLALSPEIRERPGIVPAAMVWTAIPAHHQERPSDSDRLRWACRLCGRSVFHQDLWAARMVFEQRPSRHVDVGSRIDGFVAHVLPFMLVTVVDIRPLARDTV